MFKSSVALTSVLAAVLLGGCTGGEVASVQSSADLNPPIVVPASGRALLGPLSGATVKVFAPPNFTTPLLTTTTATGPAFADIGKFQVPANLLTADSLYLVVVSGGQDVDANDDGVADATASANAGTLHALVSGSEFGEALTVSLVTEMAYRRVAYWVAADYPATDIRAELDARARFILRTDVNGDGAINRLDLAAWNPATDRAALRFAPTGLPALASGVRANTDQFPTLLGLTDPIVRSIPLPDAASSAEASGSALFVFTADTAGNGALRAFSLADPDAPVAAGVLPTSGSSVTHLAGNSLFALGTNPAGSVIRRYDVSNLSNLLQLAEAPASGNGVGLAQAGSRLYMSDSNFGLVVMDAASGAQIGQGPDGPYDVLGPVAASGNFAYVSEFGQIDVWNVADPASPAMTRVLPFTDSFSFPGSMVVFDGRLFVTDFDLFEYNLADPANPVLTARYPGIGGNLRVIGGVLYAGSNTLDATIPGAARQVRQVRPGSFANGGAVIGGGARLYSVGATDIQVWDAAVEPPNPFVQNTPAAGTLIDLARNASFVFAATRNGFDVFGFSTLTGTATRRGHFDLPAPPANNRLTTANDRVYIGNLNTRDFHVVGVANPDSPAELGRVTLSARPRDVAVEGSMAYISASPPQVLTVDVSNDALPAQLGAVALPGTVFTLSALGTTVYAPVNSETVPGLYVVDASNPANPVIANVLRVNAPVNLGDGPFETRVAGNRLFMAVSGQGEFIYDLASPTAPSLLGAYDHFGIGFSRFLPDGQFGYGFAGDITVLDLSNPAQPRHLYYLDAPAGDAVRAGDRLLARSFSSIGVLRPVVHKLP
ncbi:MAG TPA: hypothetical protein VM074_02110 [Solimonas sp.]|nr:hypothetical protein [Solimonas sp.]